MFPARPCLVYSRDAELISFYRAHKMHKDAIGRMRLLIDDDAGGVTDKSEFSIDAMIEYLHALDDSEVESDIVDDDDWIFMLSSSGDSQASAILAIMRRAMSVERSMRLLRVHAPALCLEFMEDVSSSAGFNAELLDLYIKAALQERDRLMKQGVVNLLQWERDTSDVRDRLIAHLKNPAAYSADEVLQQFPEDALFKERSVIYRGLRNHKRALQLLVLRLGDVDRAIRYADDVWRTSVGGKWIGMDHRSIRGRDTKTSTIETTDMYAEGNDRDIYVLLLELMRGSARSSSSALADPVGSVVKVLNARYVKQQSAPLVRIYIHIYIYIYIYLYV